MTTERNSSSSLRRALDLVDVVAEYHGDGGPTLTELALKVELPKSTTLRLLAPLLEHGYVESHPLSGRYRLGPALACLGTNYLEGLDLRATASDLLRKLSEETGETVHLSVPQGVSMVYIEKVEAPQPVRMASRVGSQVAMYSTASGWAYLALADDAVMEAVIIAGLPRRTATTPTTAAELRAAVTATRKRGYAIGDTTNEEHIRGIGAAIVDETSRPIAVVSIVGPDFSMTPERFDALGHRAIETARAISNRLGAPAHPLHNRKALNL
ncbi:IclR family transcriptional regulator [Microbacterium sp. NPDC076895]|uniref:IclR family transcriptional regulator n=1 Tax=Microbacterium sp. NPDC076895 TaxID=3154957 RepID=UPI003415D74A